MKSIMLSIQPKWCELIASGKKTVEVRKSAPKLEMPFKCYIYETKGLCDTPTFIDEDEHISYSGRGQVIGEFVCDNIEYAVPDYNPVLQKFYYGYVVDLSPTCLTEEELQEYAGIKPLYFWHIHDLKIYDTPKELGEFSREIGRDERVIAYSKLTRPFQSWGYVEELS